jgi:hypothetical protein
VMTFFFPSGFATLFPYVVLQEVGLNLVLVAVAQLVVRKSRVRFPMMSLEFFNDLNLPVALWSSS